MGVVCAGAVLYVFAAVPRGEPVDASTFQEVLFEDNEFSVSDLFVTSKFTAGKGQGDNIRVWFENTSKADVTVRLYKQGFLGKKQKMLKLGIRRKSKSFETYTDAKADTGTYFK